MADRTDAPTGQEPPIHPETADQLAHIREVSQNARTTWFGLLALLAFVSVTLMAHKDSDFFARGVETDLPLVDIAVPTVAFFIAAPLLLAAVYAYLHLYLRTLWDALAAVEPQPGGTPLAEQIYPWLLTQSALSIRRDGASTPRAMDDLTGWISVLITWVFGLLALGHLWTESLALHNPWLSLWVAACLLFAGFVGLRSYLIMRWLMIGRARADAHAMPTWMRLSTIAGAVTLAYLSWQTTHGGLPLGPGVNMWLTSKAQMREVELIPRPTGWVGYRRWFRGFERRYRTEHKLVADEALPDADRVAFWQSAREGWEDKLDDINGPSLPRADLRLAEMPGAFLPGADLRGAQLRGADLEGAVLSGANFGRWDPDNDKPGDEIAADLRETNLSSAEMQGAILGGAQMQGADVGHAQMQGADLSHAQMQGAILGEAQMQGAHLGGAQMQNADCSWATLRGANLQSAVVLCRNLQPDQLQAVVGNSDTRLPLGYAVWSCLHPSDPAAHDLTAEEIAGLPGYVVCQEGSTPIQYHGTWDRRPDGSWQDIVTGTVTAEWAEDVWQDAWAYVRVPWVCHAPDLPPGRECAFE
ncbi:MAG: pentapeptide repeat-containing protein [Pseudomonadota bacterium]